MSGPLPDIVAPGIRLLLVGINPGRRSAALGQHFAGPGNRFWPALHAAGITPERFEPADQHRLADLGVGLTNIVARETATAGELPADELRSGAERLTRDVARWRPVVVAVLGISAYRVAFDRPKAARGRQDDPPAPDSVWWVLHNPSGLNAHARPADHADALHAAALEAGLPVGPRG